MYGRRRVDSLLFQQVRRLLEPASPPARQPCQSLCIRVAVKLGLAQPVVKLHNAKTEKKKKRKKGLQTVPGEREELYVVRQLTLPAGE